MTKKFYRNGPTSLLLLVSLLTGFSEIIPLDGRHVAIYDWKLSANMWMIENF